MSDSLGTYTNGSGQFLSRRRMPARASALSGGSIEGDITARDGAVATLQSSLNTLASQLINSVNQMYSTGYDLNGNTSQDFFTGSGRHGHRRQQHGGE